MRGFIPLFLIIVAPFVVAAAGLLLWERRKMSRPHRLELEGLLEELGFKPQETYFAGREIHHPFRRGGDEVDCFSDGGSNDVAFRIQGRLTIVSQLSNPTIAALIRNHPEILRGEFQALIAAEDTAMTQAKAERATSR